MACQSLTDRGVLRCTMSSRVLPLFPLNAVLFPGMTLPLHIFEPRYQLMLRECMDQNRPFGAVLIEHGLEVGGSASPYPVGTSAYVVRSEQLEGGRLNIQGVGYQRFKIRAFLQKRSYLVAKVEDFPVSGENDHRVHPAANRLSRLLQTYVKLVATSSTSPPVVDRIPDNALALAYLTAILLPLPLDEKQALLTIPDLLSLLDAQIHLLRRELMLALYLLSESPRSDSGNNFLSRN